MADEQNFLSNKAVRQISKMRSDVRNLTNRVNRLGVSGPRTQGQVFATLGDFVDSSAGSDGYDATQAINGGDGGSDWSSMENGRLWGDATSDIGLLYPFESDATDLVGTYPVYQFSDGTNLLWGFEPRFESADETVSFKHYIDESNDIRFYEGNVWIQEDAAVIVDDGAGFPLTTDQAYWVEIDTAYSSVSSVNSTVQAGTMGQFLTVESGPSLTTKVLLATVEDSNVVIAYEGDMHFESLYTPEYGPDFYDSTENEGQYFGLKEHTGTGDDVNFEYFVEGNMFSDRILAGEMVKHTEEVSNFKFGGVTEEESPEYTSGIDTAVENQITLSRSTLDYKTKAGLIELLESNPSADVVISALAKWLGIEAGGVFKHLNSPVTSTSDPEHWFYYSFSGIKNGAGGTVTITIYVDIKGHIWKVDEDEQPPPVENYRYTHCSDPSTYPDLIFTTDEGTTTILVSDQCYSFVDTTEADATSPVPTVSDTFATCQLCTGSVTNEQWNDCDTDSPLVVLSPGHTDVDFAYPCIGGVLVRGYFDVLTATVATDPTVVKQCDDAAPGSCDDLVGWPASDGFSGAGCDSATVGDQDWVFRFAESFNGTGTRTTAIISSALNVTLRSSAPASFYGVVYTETVDGHAGEYIVTLDVSQIGPTVGTDNGIAFRLYHGANIMRIISSISGNFYDAGSESNVNGGTYQAASLTIKRIASGKIEFYQGGALLGTSTGVWSGDLTKIEWQTFNRGTTDHTFKYPSLLAEDGAGNDLRIDIEGKACV